MKRGLIAWDRAELPAEAFEARLASARKSLEEQGLPALIVYSDLWKSNHGRFFSNFMPYFNRALLAIPLAEKPFLLCGLSPRVYPWIKSVTIIEEILPSPNLAQRMIQVCSDKGWKKAGVLDLDQLPYDLHTPLTAAVECVDVVSSKLRPAPDQWEVAMYRRAAQLAREILNEELPGGVGLVDHQFVGRLERKLRRAGAEDAVILLTNGRTPPVPANGSILAEDFSVVLAMEYRGHWVKLSRNAAGTTPHGDVRTFREDLSGPYPYEPADDPASLFASHAEFESHGRRLFYGDTYLHTEAL